MLYKKNGAPTLDPALFRSPTAEYRGTPFWAWNCKITKDLITRQLGYLKEMGFGGGHIHSRDGMDVPYLSDEFMDLIRHCVDESKRLDMLTWLYDEDRYPSGSAGGLVTKTPKYRQRFLLLTQKDKTDGIKGKTEAVEAGEPYLVAVYDVCQNEAGELTSYRRIDADTPAEGIRWFAYCETPEKAGWYNNLTYVDTLSKEAMDTFISITHERYKAVVGDAFDDNVPAIFTDEPQFNHKETFAYATSDGEVRLPWTPAFEEKYAERYGERIEDKLPELFWDLAGGEISRTRYFYHDFVCQLFTECFADNCGTWCKNNGIAMTGHMMAEDHLITQTTCLGEAMRSYRNFQLPGIDMLCDDHSYVAAKQCQSAVHQYAREGMLSELYGVTDWDYDFRGHKHQGDWQAALGVTVRVPHLSWMSMHGDAKRDYPASIFYQSPWYKEYPYIENHFARLNTALTRGTPLVDVAVLHPIESYWLHWGPTENTGTVRARMENNFHNIIEWLLFAQLDFDFVSESLLPEQFGGTEDGRLCVGAMRYKTIVVPAMETIRSSSIEILEAFRAAGGTVILMGDLPKYIDALPASMPAFTEDCQKIPFSRDALIEALEPFRLVGVRDAGGGIAGDYIYNYRQDTDCRWLFLCHGRPMSLSGGNFSHYNTKDSLRITIKGDFTPVIWDTLTGETHPVPYTHEAGKTTVYKDMYAQDSLLLRLLPYDGTVCDAEAGAPKVIDTHYSFRPVSYLLDEPNALLLDRAEYRVDTASLTSDVAPWHPEEEMLRLNRAAAKEAGLPAYNHAQPWVEPPEVLSHYVDLRMRFVSEIEYEGACLAIENASLCQVLLNGEEAASTPEGYFVDESIGKLALPKIRRGENILLIRTPIGIRTKVEWCYLLGDFGVTVAGCERTLCALPERLGFSNVVTQKLPFYTGNIAYTEELETEDCRLTVRVSEYRGALVRVFLDGEDKGVIAFSPYKLDLGPVKAGRHQVTYKLFGNRYNAFGALHNTVRGDRWCGPPLWFTTGDKWSYEYNLHEMGILASPVIEILKV